MKSSDLERTFYELSKSEYTWEELQQRPLPDGVDPTRLERYLNAQDFMVSAFEGIFVLLKYETTVFL